jgi:hypothetical protein
MPEIKMPGFVYYSRDRSDPYFFLMPHQETTTRLADLFSGGKSTNFYRIPHHQILFKKIKSPKIKGLSLYFFARKYSSTLIRDRLKMDKKVKLLPYF